MIGIANSKERKQVKCDGGQDDNGCQEREKNGSRSLSEASQYELSAHDGGIPISVCMEGSVVCLRGFLRKRITVHCDLVSSQGTLRAPGDQVSTSPRFHRKTRYGSLHGNGVLPGRALSCMSYGRRYGSSLKDKST